MCDDHGNGRSEVTTKREEEDSNQDPDPLRVFFLTMINEQSTTRGDRL